MRTTDAENFTAMQVSGRFLSRLYYKDIFILSSHSNDYFYINEHIPCFYEDVLAEIYIKSIKIYADVPLTFLKIDLHKISLLRRLPIKPVVYTETDRRGLKEVKYYSDKEFLHILVNK